MGTSHVLSRMADGGLNTQRLEALQSGAVLLVRTRNGVTQVKQNLGNAGHADTADADEVDVLNSVFHVCSSPFFWALSQLRWDKAGTKRP